MKRIQSPIKSVELEDYATTKRLVRIYKDSETGEFVCRLFIDTVHYSPSDYFTDDYDDAIGTAKEMCKEPK